MVDVYKHKAVDVETGKDTWGLLARQTSIICEPQVLVRDCLKKYSGQLLETNTKG